MKGRITYVPPSVFDELNDIKKENKLKRNSDAFREMVNYTRVGREAERLYRFDIKGIIKAKNKRKKEDLF